VAVAAPQGRVVRIEEERTSAKAPVLCGIQPSLEGVCLGTRPRVGDLVVVVADQAVRAEVQISHVEQKSSCSTAWRVQGTLRSGSVPTRSIRAMAIGDGNRYRTMETDGITSPAGNDDEKVVLAFDSDNDKQPDLLVTRYSCDAAGVASQLNPVDRCIDIYTRTRTGLVKQSQTRQMSCL
jgi:hypothetical protein